MAADIDTDVLDRLATSHVQRHAVYANFIWRETTGRDIGVDAILEQPSPDLERDELRGLILLQIKGGSDPDEPNVSLQRRHYYYWVTQQLPVVVCRVFPDHRIAYWVDFKAWQSAINYQLKAGTKTWTLPIGSMVLGCPYLHVSRASAEEDAADLKEWLQGVLGREATGLVKSTLTAVEDLLGAGHPEEAIRLHDTLAPWAVALIDRQLRNDVLASRARTLRRLGQVPQLTAIFENATGVSARRRSGFELAIAHWTEAMRHSSSDDRERSFENAVRVLGNTAAISSTGGSFEELRDSLVNLTAVVNIRSSWSLVSSVRWDASEHAIATLSHAIEAFERTLNSGEMNDYPRDRAHRHVRNSLRAVCRFHLSSQNVTEAVRAIERLKRYSPAEDEALALTDQMFLEAWLQFETGTADARAIWRCGERLLRTMNDPLLTGFAATVQEHLRSHGKMF